MVLFTEVSSHYSYMHVLLCNYCSSDIHTCTIAQAHTNKQTNKNKTCQSVITVSSSHILQCAYSL